MDDIEPFVARGGVPHADCPAVAGGGQPAAVRTERNGVDLPDVSHLESFTAGGRIPDPGRAAAAGGQPAAVRTERHGVDLPEVAHLESFTAGGRIPDPGRAAAAGGQPAA